MNQSEPLLPSGEYREFEGNILPPNGVRFLPGGTMVALGQLGKVELRSLRTGAIQRTIEAPWEKAATTTWAPLPSGDRILWSGKEKDLRLVALSGEEVLRLELPAEAESYLSGESPGLGSTGAVIRSDGTMEDLSTRYRPYRAANDLAFLDGGRRVLASYGQAYALLWDLESGELLRLVGREGSAESPVRIYRVASVEDGHRVATLDTRRLLRVLDFEKGVDGEEAEEEAEEIFSVQLGHDPYQHAVDRPRDMPASPSLFGGLGAIAFTPDGTGIVAGDGTAVRHWDLTTGEERPPWRLHGDRHPILGQHRSMPRIHEISFSDDGRRALTVGVDATLRVWDVASGEQIWADCPAPCCIDHGDISPDGRHVIWAACPGWRLYAVG